MSLKRCINAIVATIFLFSMFVVVAPAPTIARQQTGEAGLSPAKPNQTDPRQPQVLPTMMPVYAFLPTDVNNDLILRNAGKFSSIQASEVLTDTSPRGGLTHFYGVDPRSLTFIDQFDHTGGLFAINPALAFTETAMSVSPSPSEICNFLSNKQLFPANSVEPLYTDCANPPYIVKQIHLSTVGEDGSNPSESIIGELIQVPLSIDIGDTAGGPNYIPMGGPGGHLSLLLGGAVGTPSLDSSLPGLQALASPMFDRSRAAAPIDYYPTVPMPVAIQRFEAKFPPAMQVDAGTPVMVYYVDFPDAPQDAVMPTWTFPDATGIISDTVVNLKNSAIPGVDGFAPLVTILSPTDGAFIPRGQPASITFSITGDQEPFTYTISSDDSVVASGVTVSGTLELDLGILPGFQGRAEGHTLSVHALNKYNVAGEDSAFLGAVNSLFLPLTARGSSLSAAAFQPAPKPIGLNPAALNAPSAPDSTLRIGVEWVMDYHNPKSNLGQTKPDAEGLYNWLGANGWFKTFNYGNDAAWEKDWRDCTLGGIDCSIGVDRAEFTYFSGHGSPAAIYFGIVKDYGGAWGGNSRFQNVRWAGFSSCQTLRAGPYVGPGNPPLTDWFNSFQGSYMLLGFHSNMADVPFGFSFGFNMVNPIYNIFPWMQPTIAQAWVNTAFQMNAGKPAYLYAVGNLNPANYTLPPYYAGPRPALTGIYQFNWVWWDE